MNVLASAAIDGVDEAVAQLQPLTVEQERHHVEKVYGSKRKGSLLEQRLACQAVDDACGRVKVGQASAAESGVVKRLSHGAHR